MKLYLIRHGIAGDPNPERWPDDRDRPLTKRGKKRFSQAAEGLAALVPSVDLVLSSPWKRAWQTAELLVEAADWPAPEEFAELAGDVPVEDLLEALRGYVAFDSIALVGHAPQLPALAAFLLTGNADQPVVNLKKGGVAALSLPDDVALELEVLDEIEEDEDEEAAGGGEQEALAEALGVESMMTEATADEDGGDEDGDEAQDDEDEEDVEDLAPGTASLRWLLTPKVLRSISG